MNNTTTARPQMPYALALYKSTVEDCRTTWRVTNGRVEFSVPTMGAWADHLDALANAIRQQPGDSPDAYARFAYAIDYNRRLLRRSRRDTENAAREVHRLTAHGDPAVEAFRRFVHGCVTPAEAVAINDNIVIDAARYIRLGKAGFPEEALAKEVHFDYIAVLDIWRHRWQQWMRYADRGDEEAVLAQDGVEILNAEIDDILAHDGEFEAVAVRRIKAWPLCVSGKIASKFGWMLEGGAA